MPKTKLDTRRIRVSALFEGGDMADSEKRSIGMASGSVLHGDDWAFPEPVKPSEYRGELSQSALLPPEPDAAAATMPGDEYQFEGAGGAEFPRERLGPDFFVGVQQRYEADLCDGVPATFSLSPTDDRDSEDPASRSEPAEETPKD